MIALLHIVIGALLACRIKPPWLALVSAFLSHYVLDLLPHWNYPLLELKRIGFRRAVPELIAGILDVSAGITIVYFVSRNFFLALLGGIIAMLPDIVTFANTIFTNPALSRICGISEKIHFPKEKNSLPVGIAVEAMVLAAGITFFLRR